MMTGFGMGFGWIGFLFMAIFWIVVIGAAVWLLSNLFPRRSAGRPTGDAMASPVDILKQRYARGEIGKEEFEAMRQDVER